MPDLQAEANDPVELGPLEPGPSASVPLLNVEPDSNPPQGKSRPEPSGHSQSLTIVTHLPVHEDMTDGEKLLFMSSILRRMDVMKDKMRKNDGTIEQHTQSFLGWVKHKTVCFFSGSSWKFNALVFFITLWALVFSAWSVGLSYEANDKSTRANDFSNQSLTAADWANYYTWAWTVCPAEQARNMSTPECEQVQNTTMPPLRRPYFDEKRKTVVALSQQLWGKIDATQLLQADIEAATTFCAPGRSTQESTSALSYPSCSSLNRLGSSNSTPAARTDGTPAFQKVIVELPPTIKTSAENAHSTLSLINLVSLSFWIWICVKALSIPQPEVGHEMVHVFSWSFHPTLRRHARLHWLWAACLFCLATPFLIIPALQIHRLAIWYARDQLFDICMTTKNIIDEPTCQPLRQLVADISLPDEIAVISAWRSYISTSIRTSEITLLDPICLSFGVWLLFLTVLRFRECVSSRFPQCTAVANAEVQDPEKGLKEDFIDLC